MASPRKSVSALSNISEIGQSNMNPARSVKSCESLYSSSSKGSRGPRHKLQPGNDIAGGCLRQPGFIPATKEVRQRVLSARRLRMKTFQNQLANAQQTIVELAQENRMLRTLHKRQDAALAKYESNNAELPQLLHSHAEELRVWQAKYRNIQAINKDLEIKLKQKESIILALSDQNKYYIQLNKDKNLDDRQKLTEKLLTLETRLQEKENDIKMLARKMQLESKQAKQQLQIEQRKTKDVLMKLEKARMELSGFRKLEELQLQDKYNLSLRRNNKTTIGDGNKDARDLNLNAAFLATDSDKNAEDTDGMQSQRSLPSTHTITQRSIRKIKTINTSSTIDQFSSRSTDHLPSQLPVPTKTMGALRRNEKGDGDAGKMTMMQLQNQHSNDGQKSENPSTEYDDEFENEEEEEEDFDNDNDNQYSEENASRNVDGKTMDKELYKENVEYYEETKKVELPHAGKKIRMKEEISSIRKQISDDYNEREAFLDTFCRQATSGAIKDEAPKKRSSIPVEHSVPSNRKNKLLAALKAIDDEQSEE